LHWRFSLRGRAVHPLQHQFGTVLRRRREAAGLSQEALAAQANLHRNYVGLLERGQRMPSILVAQQLAAALDTTLSELLHEVEQERD
jgi:transcriptional regulator with XRE-family HTH domain